MQKLYVVKVQREILLQELYEYNVESIIPI